MPTRRNQQVRPVWVPEWGPPGPHDLPWQQKWGAVGVDAAPVSGVGEGGPRDLTVSRQLTG